jgi:hypothetical protein
MAKTGQSMFSHNYKRKSGGIDKRALRAYRSSVNRKELRDQELSRRRNLAVLCETTAITSPVAEKPAKREQVTSDGVKGADGSSTLISSCPFEVVLQYISVMDAMLYN